MAWWLWVLLGFALLAFELFTPGGFFVLFFGLGALVVGALEGLGIVGPVWLQWLLFTGVSVVLLAFLRGRLVSRLRTEARDVDTLAGEAAVLLEDLPAGQIGKAELRGTAWSARNAGARELRKGERVLVERVEGLMLFVRGE
jgi:membrane protein implicated in regulation of membrane protease activity